MKQFKSFIKKEFLQIFRDKRTFSILLVIPIVQVFVLGYAITTEIRNARIAVFDPSKDPETQRIKERFQASEYFSITEELATSSQINDVFKGGDVNMVIVFCEDFARKLPTGDAGIQLIADGTDPNQASLLTGYASGILASCQMEMAGERSLPYQIRTETRMLYNPQAKSAYNFVPGVLGIVLIVVCAMMTSISIVREKETGTMEVLLASPMKPIHIVMAKMAPYFTISVANLTTVLLIAVFVMGVPIRGSLFWLIVASVLFVIVSLALGLLISTLVKTQMNAMLISGIGLMLPILIFSGLLFPIENIPEGLRWISALIPARWYIAIVRKIMIEGVEPQFFAKELCVIAGMAFALLATALKNFKVRLC